MQLANKFKKPPGYVIASILCSFGGFLFGHDTGIIGPVTVMEDFTKYVGNPSPTIHGLIVSSILFLLGSWLIALEEPARSLLDHSSLLWVQQSKPLRCTLPCSLLDGLLRVLGRVCILGR
jgi:hypothetical protein